MTVMQQVPLLGKIRLSSELHVITGLHIGGGGENLDIGGIDKPVLRDPLTREPYLAGSSIKGKLRSILERLLNKPLNRINKVGGISMYRHECNHTNAWFVEGNTSHEGANDCPVCRVFGSTGNNGEILSADGTREKLKGSNKPTRLIVRDSHLLPASAIQLASIETGLHMTEWKFENGLDRITAAANPRQIERVPAGAKFDFEIIYTIEDPTQAEEDLKHLAIALAILEDDALGGHGSRGYGKVRFEDFRMDVKQYSQYLPQSEVSPDLQRLLQITDHNPSNTKALLEQLTQPQQIPGS
jgi:CRISPR-associated protein Csm3